MSRVLFSFILLSGVSVILCQNNRPQSDCEEARAKAQKSRSVINLVPNCEPNGDYSQLQCHSNSTWCQCWKTDGTPVSQPSRKTKKCDCIMARHNVRALGGPRNPDGPIGAYVPQCAQNGGYEKKQCHGSTGMCWCVNDGGQQVGEKVSSTTLNCA